jgi:hypothetical protein
MHHWEITKDYLDTDRTGRARHWRYADTTVDQFKARKDVKRYAWRTLDDDGNKCHKGYFWVTERADGGECLFAPLDEFSSPDVGATEIQYYNHGDQKGWVSI